MFVCLIRTFFLCFLFVSHYLSSHYFIPQLIFTSVFGFLPLYIVSHHNQPYASHLTKGHYVSLSLVLFVMCLTLTILFFTNRPLVFYKREINLIWFDLIWFENFMSCSIWWCTRWNVVVFPLLVNFDKSILSFCYFLIFPLCRFRFLIR